MLKVLGFDGNPYDQRSLQADADRFIRQVVRAVASGNYVAGGDILDLTNGGGTATAPNIVPPAQSTGLISIIPAPIATTNTSLSAANGGYNVIFPAGGAVPLLQQYLSTIKLKIYVGAGTEYVAGAYGADVLADIIQLELVWAR